ncbi:MAG: hypothetical protein JXB49_10335 [Bacteroidales bacterium]|nr:hypothetical protein [Bacteroidales bacterium]
MKMVRLYISVIMYLSMHAVCFSQAGFSLYMGTSLPLSDFASEDMNNVEAGGARMGFTMGLQYAYQITESGFGVFGRVDMSINAVKEDVKEASEEYMNDMGIYFTEIEYYKYINIPVSIGVDYTYKVNDKLSMFADLGITANSLKLTDMEMRVSHSIVTVEFDLSNNLGGTTGGGVLINDHLRLSADYYMLGKHELVGRMYLGNLSEDMDLDRLPVDYLAVTLGVTF